MKKASKLFSSFLALLLITTFTLSLFYSFTLIQAKECNEGDPELQQICLDLNKLNEALQMSIAATQPLEAELAKLDSQIENIQKSIDAATAKVNQLEQDIFNREVELGYQKEILAARVRSYYKKSRQYSPLLLFLASTSAADLLRELSYRQTATNKDKKIIISVSQDLVELKNDKEKLEQNKISLANLQKDLDQQAEFFRTEIAKAKEYQTQLSTEIAELTAKQQALLAEKAGVFKTSVGDVPPADDPASRPDYDPGFRPALAAFSFGAPHRKGMSQYGAFGRAKDGQNAETILKAYYGDIRIEHRDLPATIATTVGTLPFEDNYMKGIAEMPSKWGNEGGLEALKAQAIAARSYAIRAGKPICITEACQVYSSSKAANPSEAWRRAVEETRGMVVVSSQSNDIVSAWYASTAGGYLYSYTSVGHTTPGIWDTTCGNQGCWTDEAYEKKAGSPWFYKGWYKSRSGASCGRSHPWLTEAEFADILNAVIVYRSGQGVEHILPIDYVSCFSASGDPWSIDQMRQNADNRGGAITSVNSADTTYGTDGKTAKLVFGTNRGSFEVSGEEFKTVFNLRAPGRIALKSRLFNIEKK